VVLEPLRRKRLASAGPQPMRGQAGEPGCQLSRRVLEGDRTPRSRTNWPGHLRLQVMPHLKGTPKTGGRKKGTPNKATAERQAQVAATDKTPLEIMMENARWAYDKALKRSSKLRRSGLITGPNTGLGFVPSKVNSVESACCAQSNYWPGGNSCHSLAR
jgi:hypothetical protein